MLRRMLLRPSPVASLQGSTPVAVAAVLYPQHQYQRRRLSSTTSSSKTEEEEARPPFPPFTRETALEKVRKAELAWNSRDPEAVSRAYTIQSDWRNRDEFFKGREAIKNFLRRKWQKEQDYVLMKELWAYHGNRIAVRFEYEWHDDKGQWYRSHGNEQWQFDDKGLMERRDASINDVPIQESERRYTRNPKTGLVEYPHGHP